MENRDPKISIVTPVFNEVEGVQEFYDQVSEALKSAALSYQIIFIDDGSTDGSFNVLKQIQEDSNGIVKVICLARNFGHQMAITAGVHCADGDAVVVMDSDLQDPPDVILKFIEKWREGYDVVYGVRSDRKGETWFKRFTAEIFYKAIRLVSNVDIPSNVGDFYLLDRKVVDVLNQMEERHRFIRGLVAWAGFRRFGVSYVRQARVSGETKYGLLKMITFSLDAFTSFSFVPLRLISLGGAVISALAFIGILAVFVVKIANPQVVLGWSSLMAVVLFMGGIQLFAVGMIGEYLARIGDDTKKRPLYTVQEILG